MGVTLIDHAIQCQRRGDAFEGRLPTRRDRRWQVELAPLTRMQAWGVEELKPGAEIGVLGFTFTGEQGEAVLRAEYLFVGDKAYGLRSSPA